MKSDKDRKKSTSRENRNQAVRKVLRVVVLLTFLALILLLFWPGGPEFKKIKGQNPYNVILITVDTLRADRLGCYGWQPEATPAVNRLASEGILF